MAEIPVLWLCGPPGVGKTAVAWSVYRRLVEIGAEPAFVDIDQLAVCYPEIPTDPGRHTLKSRNLAALRAWFTDAGRRCIVVSGVVDSDRGPARTELGGGLAVVRLRADPATLRRRLEARPGVRPDLGAVASEAATLDQSSFADFTIDTTSLDIEAVADLIDKRTGSWWDHHAEIESARERAEAVPAGGERGSVLFLTGPTGVGKSTIGFQAYLQLLHDGGCVAFVDVDQICVAGDQSMDHGLRARNLAAIWSNFREAGAEQMIVVGPVQSVQDTLPYAHRLGADPVTWIRLTATDQTLQERILSRRHGGSWAQPGDPLLGVSESAALHIAEQAAREARALEALDIGPSIRVDNLEPNDAARTVLALHQHANTTREHISEPPIT